MSESQGRDLKPPVDGMFYEIFGFGTFFRHHNFKNEIDAWETTVQMNFAIPSSTNVIVCLEPKIEAVSTPGLHEFAA